MQKLALACFLFLALSLSGCFQTYSDDDDLRTVPTTNNPQIVPSHGTALGPGMPQMPH